MTSEFDYFPNGASQRVPVPRPESHRFKPNAEEPMSIRRSERRR